MAMPCDAETVGKLLAMQGEQYRWSANKWHLYYSNYPVETALSILLEDIDGSPIGHCGLLPISVSDIRGGLVVHTFICPGKRVPLNAKTLLLEVEDQAQDHGMRFLCGFPNSRFATVAQRLVGWTITGCFQFVDVAILTPERTKRKFWFSYPKEWFVWKFGEEGHAWVQDYDKNGRIYHQLLKTNAAEPIQASIYGVEKLNCWAPGAVTPFPTSKWAQPFMVRILDRAVDPGMLELCNWYVEMGDSDTFEGQPAMARVPRRTQ